VVSIHDLIDPARTRRPAAAPVARQVAPPRDAPNAGRTARQALAVLRQSMGRGRGGNGPARVAAIQRLQQTVGNRAARRLVQRVARPAARPVRLARVPVALQRALHPKAERALDFAIAEGAGVEYQNTRGTFAGNAWLSEAKQAEVVHLRTWNEKRRNAGNDALDRRLELTRALLMVVYKRYLLDKFLYLNNPNIFQKRAAEAKAYSKAIQMRDGLKSWGVAKATGLLKPELVKELDTIDQEHQITPNAQLNVGPRIEVRGTSVPGGLLGKLKKVKLHSFIVYTNAQGQQHYIAAHADPDYGDDQNPSPLIAKAGLYEPGVHEWDPSADKRVLEDRQEGTADKWEQLLAAKDQVNAQFKPYHTLKRNCNTAAAYILRTAGVNNIQPPGGTYIGWGNNL
jgi:hypothetical protein